MNNVSVNDFREVKYISWNNLQDFLMRNKYYNIASKENYCNLKSMVKGSSCSKLEIYRIAYEIVSHTTFNDDDTFEGNIAFMMSFISDKAIHTFYQYEGGF